MSKYFIFQLSLIIATLYVITLTYLNKENFTEHSDDDDDDDMTTMMKMMMKMMMTTMMMMTMMAKKMKAYEGSINGFQMLLVKYIWQIILIVMLKMYVKH